jgi:hypothetical protein
MFPLKRDGQTFTFLESGLQHADAQGKETQISFSEKIRLAHSPWTGKLSLKSGCTKIPLSCLNPGEQRALLLEFLQRWKVRHPDAAKKAAFDYVDGQSGFVAVAFVASLFFALPLAVGLLADSRNQFSCTKILQENHQVGAMDVVKFKKKRKGHYILDLEFTAPDGTKITGRDQVITQDETTIPKTVPVVYSPEKPACWSLTPNLSGTEVNWAKRRYFGAFTLLFGTFFLVISLYGIFWALARWSRKRPFRVEIGQMAQL